MTELVIVDLEQGGPMSGEESYPVIGNLFFDEDFIQFYLVQKMMKRFKGLPLMGGCLEKARLAQEQFASTIIIAGKIRIASEDNTSFYGHDFNPPFEMHAWLIHNNNPNLIIDLALPGVILRGMKEKDEHGPFLTGREPVILAGKPPEWIVYEPKTRVEFI